MWKLNVGPVMTGGRHTHSWSCCWLQLAAAVYAAAEVPVPSGAILSILFISKGIVHGALDKMPVHRLFPQWQRAQWQQSG